jgi:4'-phosphopantetheinyl transferase
MQAAAGKNPMENSALQLWFAYPGDLAEPEVEESCLAILDEAERARAARLQPVRRRRQFLATHALTRVALSHGRALPPQSWRFSRNEYGKPSPIPECGLRFSQSDSVEMATCLVALPDPIGGAAVEVGVDLESFARAEEIVPLAPRVFSKAERAQLDALPAADRADRALTLWTLKEAYIKARGMGLTLPLQEISFLFEDAETFRFEVDSSVDEDLGRWQFCRINHAGHRIALAVEAAAAGDPEIFEASPPLDPPTHLWLSAIAATAGSAGEVREEAAESPRPRPQVFRPLLGKGRRK